MNLSRNIYLASPECRQLLHCIDGCLSNYGLTLDDLGVEGPSIDPRFLALPITAYSYLADCVLELREKYLDEWATTVKAETLRQSQQNWEQQ